MKAVKRIVSVRFEASIYNPIGTLSGKKIAFFLCGDFPEGNGANSRIKAFAHAFRESGAGVQLVYLWATSFNNDGINKITKGMWEGIPYEFLNNRCTRPRSYAGKAFDSMRAFVNTFRYFFREHNNIGVCYCYSPDIVFFWPLIICCKWYGIKIIFEQTELKSSYRDGNTPRQSFWKFFNQWDESHAQQLCHHMVVISKNLHTHYRDYFPKEQLSLIPIVVDLRRFTNHAVKKTGLIGYIGSFGYKDGVEGILRAFRIARSVNPELKLRLMGYCENFERIKKLISEQQLEPYVEMSGLVLYKDVPKLLEECELLLMNRIDTKFAHYGSPTKLAEYLASGVPTIVTNVGDVKEYLTHDHDTYVIPPEDDEALAAAILLRFSEPQRFQRIGTNGRRTCEAKFSHQEQLKQLLDVIRKLAPDTIS